MQTYPPIIPLVELCKNIDTIQKNYDIPMYMTRGYVDTINVVPFANNGIYGHDHG
jgi:hypothetical protein